MTLDQMQVLNTIVEAGSFRAAGERLHRAQSAISHAVKGLEQELGISLFSRDSYRPRLTPEGRAIHRKAKVILEQAQEISILGRQLSIGHEAELDLAIAGILPGDLLKNCLAGFANAFADTQLNIHQEHLGVPLEMVLAGKACLGVTTMFAEMKEVERLPLGQILLLPVAAPEFPAFQEGRELTWADMLHYRQLRIMDGPQALKEEKASIVEGARAWRVSNLALAQELITAGHAWAYLPEWLVKTPIKKGQLRELALETGRDTVDYFLLRRRDRPMGPAAQYLWEALRAAAQ